MKELTHKIVDILDHRCSCNQQELHYEIAKDILALLPEPIFMCKKHTRVNCGECFEVLPKPISPKPKIEELDIFDEENYLPGQYEQAMKINELVQAHNRELNNPD